MPPIIAIPPAYESTGYRRFLGFDGTMYPGRVAIELPDSMSIVDEPATATRPARSRLLFTGVPGGAVPLTRVVNGTSPLLVNGGPSATLAADITLSILAASGANPGSMSIADFTKLAGIESGAINAQPGLGLGRSGSTLSVVADPIGTVIVSGSGVRVDASKIVRQIECGASTITGTTTIRYLTPGYNSGTPSANPLDMPVAKSFKVDSIHMLARIGGTAGASIKAILRLNGVASAGAELTTASDATSGSASFSALKFEPGDSWGLQIEKSASIASSPVDIFWSLGMFPNT